MVAAGFASYYVYDRIADQIAGADLVSVPFVEGKLQSLAVKEISEAELVPKVRKRANENVEVGRVFDQDPAEGTRVDKDSTVVIFVSSGRAKTTVPDVRGMSRDEAVAALTAANLDVSVAEVYSEQQPGIVTAQSPGPGTRLVEGETVRINVSRGIKQVSVPSVVGDSLDAAIAAIEDAGFVAGSPVFENADRPENTVIAQDPAGGSLQRPGTTISLTVSKGPAQVQVPDVEGLDLATARATLQAEGFRVSVVRADTDLIEEDGIVLAQSPAGGVDADPKSTVTLTVGRFVEPPPTETAPDGDVPDRADRDDPTETEPFPVRRVAILMGGRSSEHEISLASARSVIAALDPDRYDVVTVEIGHDGRWALGDGGQKEIETRSAAETLPVPSAGGAVTTTLAGVEVVLPILHGPFGEDGTVQGMLELAGVPYVGAGVAASAVCMDKDLFKAVLRDQGVPVTRNITLRNGAAPESPFGYPVFVKPARLGSSVGITKAHDEEELRAAVELAFRHDEKVLVEEFVSGIEVEVGVLGNREPFASLVGEIVVTNNEWYDYEAKYEEGEMDLVIPARIADEQTARVQELAVQAFVATECEGMARVDCFVTEAGDVLVNELNTIPGFTSTSVYAKLFEESGVAVRRVCSTA